MILRSRLFACLAPLLACGGALAAGGSGPSALTGSWRAECDAWGTPAVCTQDWAPGLHADQTTIHYAIRGAADGATIFEGRGVYRDAAGAIGGYWSDSGGAIHPLSSVWEDGTLVTHWGVAGGEQGRTEYALTPDGTMTVTDWSLTDDGWVRFMTVDYERAD